jgi:outer membrane protein OmpA-like peptidoglycan-associated protein
MKSKNNLKKGSRMPWSFNNLTIKSLILSALVLTGILTTLQAQDSITKPSWWFGVAAGANLNFYRGTTQEINSELTAPAAFDKGFGAGLYIAPLIEYHHPDAIWGIMLQAGYDNRQGWLEQVKTPCNCPEDLYTRISYITVEPSLRIAPFKSNFYLYAGPRLAFNAERSFTYKQGINPDHPEQEAIPNVKGDLSKMKEMLISMQIGAGYDIPISSQKKQTQFVLSPFVSFHPYFGQYPRSIETWNVTTLRVGVALKFGRGHKNTSPAKEVVSAQAKEPEVLFSVYAPKNIPVERRVRETFPIRNYVFFDTGSTVIPDRYVLLTKDKVKEFNETRLEVFTPKKLSGRSGRQLTAYYNILNILGSRMAKDSSTTVRLTGASMKGTEVGIAMAEAIKRYLVDVFGIDTSRIKTEGRIKPRIPSEKPGSTSDFELLNESDNRVSIWSNSPALLMEFQTGPNAPLKPVEINAVQEVPLDAYLSFNIVKGIKELKSWSLEIRDETGKMQKFGPYTQKSLSMKGRAVLGTKPEGQYKVKMIGQRNNGKIVNKDTTVHMVLWKPSEREEGMRYSVLFEFDESNVITLYEKYLTDIVTPKIPKNGTVIIHGHTDIIGDEAYNQKLSETRANDVRKIIENALLKAGRKDVTFDVYGFGKDTDLEPFENNLPEERFYNRTVIIDIISPK